MTFDEFQRIGREAGCIDRMIQKTWDGIPPWIDAAKLTEASIRHAFEVTLEEFPEYKVTEEKSE